MGSPGGIFAEHSPCHLCVGRGVHKGIEIRLSYISGWKRSDEGYDFHKDRKALTRALTLKSSVHPRTLWFRLAGSGVAVRAKLRSSEVSI